MLNFIDNLLNRITMYKLVFYFLICLVVAALVLSAFNLLPFSPLGLLYSSAVILLLSWAANTLFAYVFNVPANVESVWITALILILIVSPFKILGDQEYLFFLGWVSVLSQAAKYIVSFGRRHLFNPAAFAVALTSFTIGHSASWWIGTLYMLPFVLVGGVLLVRKLRRADLVWSFLVVALLTIILTSLSRDIGSTIYRTFSDSAFFFFAFIMLTEPLTSPPTRAGRMAYGAITGILFAPAIHLGSIYSTPELALLAGNIFAYAISPKFKYMLTLKAQHKTGSDTTDFVFEPDRQAKFKAGQYLEWTLGHEKSDSRGNRRYFTVASSPTENEIRLGVKFYPEPSSFKSRLSNLKPGDRLLAGQLAGDFVLPKNQQQKLAFIAGGIGITPFRSMVKFLIDKNEKRDMVLFYSNKTQQEIVYADIFQKGTALGLKVIYTLTDTDKLPHDWQGQKGFINDKMIAFEAPDYLQRTFFISGPQAMVTAFKKTLLTLGVPRTQIKTDFFPGFA